MHQEMLLIKTRGVILFMDALAGRLLELAFWRGRLYCQARYPNYGCAPVAWCVIVVALLSVGAVPSVQFCGIRMQLWIHCRCGVRWANTLGMLGSQLSRPKEATPPNTQWAPDLQNRPPPESDIHEPRHFPLVHTLLHGTSTWRALHREKKQT